MDIIKIGNRIRDERKKHKLTIAELAERADISANFLGNIERGVDVPSVETLLNIANALYVGTDALLQDNLTVEIKESNESDFESMEILKEIESMSQKQKQYLLSCIKALKNFNM